MMRCTNRDNPSAKLEDGLKEVAIGVLLAVMETYVTHVTLKVQDTRRNMKPCSY